MTTTPATPAALLEHEHAFLRRFSDYARLLDPVRARAAIERRLGSAARVEEPVPHLVVHDLLEPELYEMLEAAWPVNDIFKRDSKGRKFDLVPASPSDSGDARNAGYDLLPPALRATWDFFVFVINRQIVGPWLARCFESEIRERVALLQRAHADGLITYAMAGAQDWSFRPNVGRFMVRANGYVLKPHLDSMPYLVTALLYFPGAGQGTGWGTSLYTPDRPLDFEACVRSGSTKYFDEAGIECREVVRVPYLANTLLAFPNTLRSAHGVVAPEHEQRRVFQYHLSLKGDHEKV